MVSTLARSPLGSLQLPNFAGLRFLVVGKAFVRTMKFNLIVPDLSMPGEHGAAFLTWLREQPRDPGGNVPAVAVTAFYGRYPPDHVSGWAAYFRKPPKSTTSCRRSRRS